MERVRTTIPLDLIIEILSWLRERSLVRFRRVCKLWLSITNDPQFIDTNLDRSRKSRPPSVLLFLSHYNRGHCGITVIDDDPKRTPDRLLVLTLSPDLCRRAKRQLLMSSPCNGLVCISDVSNGFIELLNPTTGERHTPPPPHRYFDKEWWDGCEVYTLGTHSWRQIPCPDNRLSQYSGVNANGALYWQINIDEDYDGRGDVLVSFDLKNERFAPISPPDFTSAYGEKSYVIRGVVELQGSVCLQVYPNAFERMDIWMMVLSSNGNDNTTHEWALKYSVSCILPVPLFIHNERILVGYEYYRPKSKALVYHPLDCKDGCTREAYREGKPESPLIYHYLKGHDGSNFEEFYHYTGTRYSQPFAHVESLISLRNK